MTVLTENNKNNSSDLIYLNDLDKFTRTNTYKLVQPYIHQSTISDGGCELFACPFEGNINSGYPTGLKLNLQETREIYKETYKLDISVSNAKDIIDHFFSLDKKYGWRRLEFMVGTGTSANNTFRQV